MKPQRFPPSVTVNASISAANTVGSSSCRQTRRLKWIAIVATKKTPRRNKAALNLRGLGRIIPAATKKVKPQHRSTNITITPHMANATTVMIILP